MVIFFLNDILFIYLEYEKAINQHIRKENWFVWVTMTKAQVTLPIFQSLEAYWPGVLVILIMNKILVKFLIYYI